MKYHYALAARNCSMFTFTRFDASNKPIDFVRGFGTTETEALKDAVSALSTHAEHDAPAPYLAQDRAF